MTAISPETLYWIAAILGLIGLIGIVVPALPGVPFVFAGMAIAAYAGDFVKVGKPVLYVLGALTLLSVIVDFISASLGAKRIGASRQAVVGAAIGTIVGLFFGLPGLVLGPFIGAVAGEWMATRNAEHATRVGLAAWIGLVLGTLFKVVLAFVMIGIFVSAWFID
jgi:uncharacterized protein YqgC (DUF456 family)